MLGRVDFNVRLSLSFSLVLSLFVFNTIQPW